MSEKTETTLKPCPFCGGAAKLVAGPPGCTYVACTACGATSEDGTVERAIAGWNRRVKGHANVG